MAVPLHSPTYLHGERQNVIGSCCFLLQGRPTVGRSLVVRPVPGGESAGCVCLQCLFSRLFVCLPAILPAKPTALLNVLAPIQFALPRSVRSSLLAPIHCAFPPFHSMCARIIVKSVRASSLSGPAVCRYKYLQAARLSRWQLQHGPAVAARAPVLLFDCLPFFLQSP